MQSDDLARFVPPYGPSSILDPETTRDIAPDVLGPDGRMRVLPAAYWASTTPQERALFGHRNGLYSFPTVELVAHLTALIGDRSAIEIGAGNGVLADALEILGTDSFQQNKEPYRRWYAANSQPTVPYGPNVIDAHASRAVRTYKPQVVLGCWVTHKYDPKRHDAGGNEAGIDEEDILRNCQSYILVGNEKVHTGNKIWARTHEISYPPFVYSRSASGGRDFIAVWSRRR